MEPIVQRLNETLDEITKSLDVSERCIIPSANEVIFPIVSKTNILHKFVLQQEDDLFMLIATISEWDDKQNSETEAIRNSGGEYNRSEIEQSEADCISNQVLCLIEEISEKIGLEILSTPEEICSKMDCVVSFYSDHFNSTFAANCAIKLITENAGKIFRIIKAIKNQSLSISQAYNILF